MKTLPILLLAAIACLPAHASTPVKAPLVKYTGLWTNSPFTSKPLPPPPGVTVNPLEDFMLTGIAPVPGGYRITITNKKKPDDKRIIEPGRESEFKVISVNRNPEKSLGTTVVLQSGAIQGTVSFEPQLIALKAAPVAPQGNPNLPPGVNNPNQPPLPTQAGQNAGNQSAPRQPRPRIVPPPTPGANQQQQQQQTQPQTQGGRPSDRDRRDNRRR